jgi:SpoVK/Ycf46/Vps4 family AAA+-type ATPase
MPSAKNLRQMFKSVASGDQESYRRVAEEIIQEERAKQHHLLANDLERILYGRPKEASNLMPMKKNVPTDPERGVPLISLLEPARKLDDIVLSEENRSVLEEILLEHHRSELIRTYGLQPSGKLLFYGPPGCGKTLTAEILAYELELPLAILRIDSVVSSFLGQTAANLRQVFDFIQSEQVVVLFDEFDALGRERSDPTEHGEIKRVVNAFVQLIDNYSGTSILVAATNHEMQLDHAVWRRFEEVLEFDLPNIEQIRKLLELKLRGVRRDFEISELEAVSSFKGMSYADIERVARRAIKEMILQGNEFLEIRHLESAQRRELARRKRLLGDK